VTNLPWETARENFYAAVSDGAGADLRWLSADGEETTDSGAIFDELLAHASAGLEARGFAREAAARRLEPLAVRAGSGVTPAAWKRERVREYLSEGAAFADAVAAVQRDYVEHQKETLLEGSFADWL